MNVRWWAEISAQTGCTDALPPQLLARAAPLLTVNSRGGVVLDAQVDVLGNAETCS